MYRQTYLWRHERMERILREMQCVKNCHHIQEQVSKLIKGRVRILLEAFKDAFCLRIEPQILSEIHCTWAKIRGTHVARSMDWWVKERITKNEEEWMEGALSEMFQDSINFQVNGNPVLCAFRPSCPTGFSRAFSISFISKMAFRADWAVKINSHAFRGRPGGISGVILGPIWGLFWSVFWVYYLRT